MPKHFQTFNDGVCSIYSVSNAAPPGGMPTEALTKKAGPLRYEERKVGITRFYEAKRSEERIDRVIRVPRCGEVSALDVCVPLDGRQYRIRQAQLVLDVSPPAYDLALERLEAGYDFA